VARSLEVARRRVDAFMDALPIERPWSFDDFIGWMEAERGRPIRLEPVDAAVIRGAPCGLWIGREHDDVVMYAADASVYLRRHIIYHELAHILRGDSGLNVDLTTLQKLAPDVRPETVRSLLGRAAYDDEVEQEAELLATRLFLADSGAVSARSKAGAKQSVRVSRLNNVVWSRS
jgi:hypothetical protein